MSRSISHWFSLLGVTFLSFAVACDKGPPPSAPESAANAQLKLEEEVKLTDIQLYVSMVQLEGVDGTPDWTDRTERVLSMDPETGRLRTEDLGVAAGSYDLVRVKVHRSPGQGPSVILRGDVDGHPFEVGLSVTTVIERILDPAQPFAAIPNELTDHIAVVSDVEQWLAGEGGEVLNPKSAKSQRTIEQQIRTELHDHAGVAVGQLARGMAFTTTDNSDFPLLAVHEDGSRLFISTDATGRVDHTLLTGPEGEIFAVWLGEDGLPTRAVSGEHIFVFDNYDLDAATVDVGVVEPDGTIKIHREIEVEAELIQSATGGDTQASVRLALQASTLSSIAGTFDIAGGAVSGAGCVIALATTGALGALACGAVIADAVIFAAKANTDNPDIERVLSSAELIIGGASCLSGANLECLGAVLDVGSVLFESADRLLREHEPEIAEAKTLLAGGRSFMQISAGNIHSCGVTSSKNAFCWGIGNAGRLGDGTTTDRSTPVPVDNSSHFTQISAATIHTCARTTADEIFCWGANSQGQLGDGTTTSRSTPVLVSSTEPFRQVSAGGVHTCAVTSDNRAFCWGNNGLGGLGDGTTTDRTEPVAVSTTESFAQVSAGASTTCGVTTTNAVYCWGGNVSGEVGDGTTTNRLSPVPVSSPKSFVQVSVGSAHSCAVTTANQIFCWGFNSSGQLGDGTTTNRSTPVLVASAEPFRQVSAGTLHTCAVTTADEIFCWGRNPTGQVGDGTTTNRSTPVLVASTEPFRQVSGGDLHSCAVSSQNQAFCWGTSGNGRLGNGDASGANYLSPVEVEP